MLLSPKQTGATEHFQCYTKSLLISTRGGKLFCMHSWSSTQIYGGGPSITRSPAFFRTNILSWLILEEGSLPWAWKVVFSIDSCACAGNESRRQQIQGRLWNYWRDCFEGPEPVYILTGLRGIWRVVSGLSRLLLIPLPLPQFFFQWFSFKMLSPETKQNLVLFPKPCMLGC